jgi:hypothetical protein
MKIIKLFLLMAFFASTHIACQKDPIPLNGTKWKLAGIFPRSVNFTDYPKECDECFTLTFDTDYTATVRSINTETFTLDLLHLNPNVNIQAIMLWEKYDKDGRYYLDGDIFRCAIWTAKSYSATTKELKLYSDYEGMDYLLFKRIKQ